jgi:hypothetical protein
LLPSNNIDNGAPSGPSTDGTPRRSGDGGEGDGGGGEGEGSCDLFTPTFDLNDDALKILSGLFFEPYGHMEAARRSVLQGRTIGKVFEEFVGKSDSVRDALVLLSNTVGVSFLRLREYYSTADMATKKLFAAILFQNKYMGDFSECVVEIGSSLDALLVPPPIGKTTATTPDVSALQQQVGRLVDMSFLTPLVVPQNEKFLVPAAVYARDCMRTIFDLIRDDAGANMEPDSSNTVLIGSPGVGTSILFFLAAVFQAQSKTVLYCRITKDKSERASLFFMAPAENGGVGVWFSRNMNKRAVRQQGGLSSCTLELEQALLVRREEYYIFIDGPNQADTPDLLEGTYDYFCTSGGFRLYKDSERGKRRWVLDGWTRDEAISGLALLGHNEQDASDAYSLCGGNIRRMLAACEASEPIREELDGVVDQQGIEAMSLALQSTVRSTDRLSPDSLRTMFASQAQRQRKNSNWKGVMLAVQIVDSQYALGRLATKMSVDKFLESYRFCLIYGMRSVAGGYFERIIHQSVKALDFSSVVKRVAWSFGTTEESLQQLDGTGVYWIPSVSNFVSIDSALVYNHTLYSFQMTIKDRRDFNVVGFRSKFVNPVKEAFSDRHEVRKLVVYVVVPMGSKLASLTSLKFTDGKTKLPDAPTDIDFKFRAVNMEDLDSIFHSLRQLLGEINPQAVGNARRPRMPPKRK